MGISLFKLTVLGQVWSYNFQNTQCEWFQISIGPDGRTTGPGVYSLLPPCMNRV